MVYSVFIDVTIPDASINLKTVPYKGPSESPHTLVKNKPALSKQFSRRLARNRNQSPPMEYSPRHPRSYSPFSPIDQILLTAPVEHLPGSVVHRALLPFPFRPLFADIKCLLDDYLSVAFSSLLIF